jgi:cobalamin synthase
VDDQIAGSLALVAMVVALAAGYAKAFGVYQCQLVQWVIDAGEVPGRFRGLVNLAVGTALAAAFGALGARQADDPGLLALGLLAGVLASVEAAKVHDATGQTGIDSEAIDGDVVRELPTRGDRGAGTG